jgi:hypothetical protein
MRAILYFRTPEGARKPYGKCFMNGRESEEICSYEQLMGMSFKPQASAPAVQELFRLNPASGIAHAYLLCFGFGGGLCSWFFSGLAGRFGRHLQGRSQRPVSFPLGGLRSVARVFSCVKLGHW